PRVRLELSESFSPSNLSCREPSLTTYIVHIFRHLPGNSDVVSNRSIVTRNTALLALSPLPRCTAFHCDTIDLQRCVEESTMMFTRSTVPLVVAYLFLFVAGVFFLNYPSLQLTREETYGSLVTA